MRRALGPLLTLAAITAPAVTLPGLVVLPSEVRAQSPVPISVELPFRSKYYWAGVPFAAGEVQQVQLSAGLGSVTVYGFTTYDLDASRISEADLYADWYGQLTPLFGLFVGAALYNFDYGEAFGGWQGTQELYAGVVLGTLLSPTLYVAHDFDLGDGTHVTLSVAHGVPLGASGLSLDLGAEVDYNVEYYTDQTGVSYGALSAALGIPAGPVTLSPIVIVQRRLDDAFVGWVPDDEVFGVTASFSF